MAETKYEIGLLNYYCDTYEAALEFLETFNRHKPGQPICVFYGSDETSWKALFAIGVAAPDKYDILGSPNTDSDSSKLYWYVVDENGNTISTSDNFKPTHIDSTELTDELQNNNNLLFVKIDDNIGCIYYNGVLYSSPYVEDKVLKDNLTIGNEVIPVGTPLDEVIKNIYNKIQPEEQQIEWNNIIGKPTKIEDAFDISGLLQSGKNLSDLDDIETAVRNLLTPLSGFSKDMVLRNDDGEIVWGPALLNWLKADETPDETLGAVRIIQVTSEEWDEIKQSNPPTNHLYFVSSGSGSTVEYSLYIGNRNIKSTSYAIDKVLNPEGLQAQYILKDNSGDQCGVTIDIPLDKVVNNATLKTVTEKDVPYEGANVGDKYIDIEFSNQESHVYISVQDLVDIYFGGNGIDITEHEVSTIFITKDEIDEIFEKLEEEENNE